MALHVNNDWYYKTNGKKNQEKVRHVAISWLLLMPVGSILNVYSSNYLGAGSEIKFKKSPAGAWVHRNFVLRQFGISISGHIGRNMPSLSLKDAQRHK